jgi:hypothetical protein
MKSAHKNQLKIEHQAPRKISWLLYLNKSVIAQDGYASIEPVKHVLTG